MKTDYNGFLKIEFINDVSWYGISVFCALCNFVTHAPDQIFACVFTSKHWITKYSSWHRVCEQCHVRQDTQGDHTRDKHEKPTLSQMFCPFSYLVDLVCLSGQDKGWQSM